VYDEDEFSAHAALWRYPPEVCRQARGALADLQVRLAAGDPLFEMWRRYLPQVPPACLRGETAALAPDCDADPPPP